MKLMEKILSEENLQLAIKKVKKNKGAQGIDKMTVQEIEYWFKQYQEELISKIMNKQYRPMPVKRVYIPKANGKQRPLGIPTVVDRVIQQAISQELTKIYEPMLMYGKEASNRKQEIDRQHYTIPNQRPKDKHCGKI